MWKDKYCGSLGWSCVHESSWEASIVPHSYTIACTGSGPTVICHSPVNSSLFYMKVISKQPLCCSIILKTASHIHDALKHTHTQRHTHSYMHISKPTVSEVRGSLAIQNSLNLLNTKSLLLLNVELLFPSSSFVLICCFSLPIFCFPSLLSSPASPYSSP